MAIKKLQMLQGGQFVFVQQVLTRFTGDISYWRCREEEAIQVEDCDASRKALEMEFGDRVWRLT